MKKLTKVLLPVAAAVALSACSPDKEHVDPNANARAESLYSVPLTLAQVFKEIEPEIKNVDHGFHEIKKRAHFDEADNIHSEKIKQELKSIFPKNKMRNLINFSDEYFDSLIDEVAIVVAKACDCHTRDYDGFFSKQHNQIKIVGQGKDIPNNDYQFAFRNAEALMHEVGHALGLGERVAQYFAEKTLGRDISYPRVQNYNTAYDRELEKRMGEKAYWKMAFSSERNYRRAWDKYMKDVMPYQEFLDVLAVSDMLSYKELVENEYEPNPLLREFPKEENLNMYDIRNFGALFEDYINVKNPTMQKQYKELFTEYADKMHKIAETVVLETHLSVLDGYAPKRSQDIEIIDIIEGLCDVIPVWRRIAIFLGMLTMTGDITLSALKGVSGRRGKGTDDKKMDVGFDRPNTDRVCK